MCRPSPSLGSSPFIRLLAALALKYLVLTRWDSTGIVSDADDDILCCWTHRIFIYGGQQTGHVKKIIGRVFSFFSFLQKVEWLENSAQNYHSAPSQFTQNTVFSRGTLPIHWHHRETPHPSNLRKLCEFDESFRYFSG